MRDKVADDLGALDALDAEQADIFALLDRDAAYRRIVSVLPETLGLDVAWVGVPRPEGGLVIGSAVGLRTDCVTGIFIGPGQGLAGRVLATKRPHTVRDYLTARSISHHFDAIVRREGGRSMIAVPIYSRDRVLGVLSGAFRRVKTFSDRTIAAFMETADRAARAAILAERARHVAEIAVHEERRRLAIELHDTVGAMVFSLGVSAEKALESAGSNPALRGRLVDIKRRAAEVAETLRHALRTLHATPQELALAVGLQADCRAFAQRTGIPARLVMTGDLPDMHGTSVTALLEVTREALFNVQKHAHASSVLVTAGGADGGVFVSVIDDGAGLESTVRAALGLGLPTMNERLARVGGRLTVINNDERGTTLRAWVPA